MARLFVNRVCLRLWLSLLSGLCLLPAFALCGCDSSEKVARAAGAATYEEDAPPESLPDFTLRWLFGVGMGKKLHLGRMQLYYVDPVTVEEAQATGHFLRRLGLGQGESLVQLRKSGGESPGYELRIGTA